MPDDVSRAAMRVMLSPGGAAIVLLGQLVRARTKARELLSQVPFEKGQEAIMLGIKLQGEMKGLDLAIDLIFDIANFDSTASTVST